MIRELITRAAQALAIVLAVLLLQAEITESEAIQTYQEQQQ